ncbi:NAD(P)H-dependent flavin oxidoreductase [Novosphingobium mangrovi (ex Huang et al. 2023)]|uniref:Nitronate monooxygenase n=1 Tax=Novosphingobium mangrovi (ex Huang et al. 2023) TaxID=2976432 RepID=A0ABT2I1M7_9SPHN|nr:nitronate monooxygenase [Novosphingobium mangrovi (ex Huang et al. 2023)]MCT2398703.1 nitronate monooxygenase [Novosphingobium mangrovi (ex Huang et al. 2023)]
MALDKRIERHLTLPAIAAPMFLVSTPELAIACCKAGIVGSLTRNHCRDIEELGLQLRTVREVLDRFAQDNPDVPVGPLAVNISPTFSQAEFRDHLALCRQWGVSIIVTSVGDPTVNAPLVQDHGLLHFHDATTIRFAEKAAAAKVDGIVCIGAGGGGHAGTISHLAFIPQVRAMFDGTIVMAGAISTGEAIHAAEALGADLAYLGTRFIATRESGAPDAYKAMLVEGGGTDVLYTRGVNGLPASWLKASLRETGLDPDNLYIPEKRGTDHLPAGKTPWRDIWSAGQGIGLIDDLPSVSDLVRRLRHEYVTACEKPGLAAAREALARDIPVT